MEFINPVQRAAVYLIQQDLRYVYTVIKNIRPDESNYIPSMMPYFGVVIDGAEDWIKSFNNSSRHKLDIPLFDEQEREFYEQSRTSIKMWQLNYEKIYSLLESTYQISDEYFGSVCKPIAKRFKLYDIYGVDTINGVISGNTILCQYYYPFFSYSKEMGEYVKSMTEIGGKYIRLFNAMEEFHVDKKIRFDTKDYGGFRKLLVGNSFGDKFVLFSILCQINFLLYGVDMWIVDEAPVKLRFGYLLYYSLTSVLVDINEKLGTDFCIKANLKSDFFRNAMAHYKLGVALTEGELITDDVMFGLTQKIIGKGYGDVKNEIYEALYRLARQIGEYLGLPQSMISLHEYGKDTGL